MDIPIAIRLDVLMICEILQAVLVLVIVYFLGVQRNKKLWLNPQLRRSMLLLLML